MKIAYFDCFSGISGDMCLGALVDAGVLLKDIEKELKKLAVKGYALSERKVRRAGISATKVDVTLTNTKGKGHGARRWADIEKIIRDSSLSDGIKQKGHGIFKRLFEAEAKVHGETVYKVHLHELGAVDCLVDIFGTLIGLDLLGVDAVYSSAVNLGSGFVKTGHGFLPVPAPATAEMLKKVPVYMSETPYELTTPTGAAILKSLSAGFGEMPLCVPEKIGTGAGERDMRSSPNILRMLIGQMYRPALHGPVTVIETNIDDMNPQIYEYLFETLLKKGALDVYMTQVIMKKMRPGIKLTVLCERQRMDEIIGVIFSETTSIGVRYYETSRTTMDRRFQSVETGHGKAMVKISGAGGTDIKCMPEYEDCKKIAALSGRPVSEIMEEAKKAAGKYMKNRSKKNIAGGR